MVFEEAEIATKRYKKCLLDNEAYQMMIKSKPYNSFDENLVLARTISSELAERYSQIQLKDYDYNLKAFNKAQSDYLSNYVFHQKLENIYIEPPFRVDFGPHIKFGKNFYANFNAVFLDCAPITFGDNVLCGPNVTFTTAGHPTDPELRLKEEFAHPIVVGNNVWFGSNSIVLPGIKIGDGSVIGAGSIVTKDVEPYTVVVGAPARKIKDLRVPETNLKKK